MKALLAILCVIGFFLFLGADTADLQCPSQDTVIKYTCPYCKKTLSIKIDQGLFADENKGKTWMSHRDFLEGQKKAAEESIELLKKQVKQLDKNIKEMEDAGEEKGLPVQPGPHN